MSIRDIKCGDEAAEKLMSGLNQLANIVKVTLGPQGKNVIIQGRGGRPRVTKDGVTVARNVCLPNQFEDQGARLALDVAIKAANTAGDGTTTAIVLAQAIMEKSLAAKALGHNVVDLKKGIEIGTKAVVEYLKKIAKPVTTDEQLIQVGKISSNGDEKISKLIVEAINTVGEKGVITYQESHNVETTLKITHGYRFNTGYQSEAFCNVADKQICELKDVYILITNQKVNYEDGLLPYLKLANAAKKALLVIAEEVEGQSYAWMLNSLAAGIPVCPVKAPAFGTLREAVLQDIAAFTGGEVVIHEKGDRLDFDIEDEAEAAAALKRLGKAKRVTITRDSTTIVEGYPNVNQLLAYCDAIMGSYEAEEDAQAKVTLHERLSRLTKGVANILVGGHTEAEVFERKDRVEDALNACLSAKEEGIVPGGGIALFHCREPYSEVKLKNDAQEAGFNILMESIQVPLCQIIRNAGGNEDAITFSLEERGALYASQVGWDAEEGRYGDMYEMGIVDPVKVTRIALESASSIACLKLMNGGIIVDALVQTASGQLSPQMIL